MAVIYVLPTEESLPPRAIIGEPAEEGIEGMQVTWSRDTGTWMTEESVPLPEEVAQAITEHAKGLGVEEFLDD